MEPNEATLTSLSEKLAALDLSEDERSLLHAVLEAGGDDSEVEGFASPNRPPDFGDGRAGAAAHAAWLRNQMKMNIIASNTYAAPRPDDVGQRAQG